MKKLWLLLLLITFFRAEVNAQFCDVFFNYEQENDTLNLTGIPLDSCESCTYTWIVGANYFNTRELHTSVDANIMHEVTLVVTDADSNFSCTWTDTIVPASNDCPTLDLGPDMSIEKDSAQSGFFVSAITTNNPTVNWQVIYGSGTIALSTSSGAFFIPDSSDLDNGFVEILAYVIDPLCDFIEDTIRINFIDSPNQCPSLSLGPDVSIAKGTASNGIMLMASSNMDPEIFWQALGSGTLTETGNNQAVYYPSPGDLNFGYVDIMAGTVDTLCDFALDTVRINFIDDSTGTDCSFMVNCDRIGNNIEFIVYNPNQSGLTYFIDLGDGTSGTFTESSAFWHEYNTPGEYIVTVISSDSSCNYTWVDTVAIKECEEFVTSATVVDYTVYVHSNADSIGGFITWDFGDGSFGYDNYDGHTYQFAGTYYIIATFQSYDSTCFTMDTIPVTIEGPASGCDFNVYYTFGDNTLIANTDADPSKGFISWNLGDGTSQFGNQIQHTYTSPGYYTVVASYQSHDSSCQSAYTFYVTVDSVDTGDSSCSVSIELLNQSDNHIEVQAITSGNTAETGNYTWYYGDESIGFGKISTHSYSETGQYTVTVAYSDQGGCETGNHITVDISTISVPTSNINGTVWAGEYPLDKGVVALFEIDNGSYNYVSEQSIVPEDSGYYNFLSLEAGDYILFSYPDPNSSFMFNYLPTYYDYVTDWAYASPISLSGTDQLIDIDLVPYQGDTLLTGIDQVTGYVFQLDGDVGMPIAGATVEFYDESDNFVGYTVTDAYGWFNMFGLSAGNYRVTVSAMGIEPISQWTQVDGEPFSVETMEFEVKTVAGNDPAIDLTIEVTVFPNPAINTINVQSDLTIMNISIIDVYGIEVKAKGQEISDIDVSNLKPGIYTVVAETQYGITTERFTKQ